MRLAAAVQLGPPGPQCRKALSAVQALLCFWLIPLRSHPNAKPHDQPPDRLLMVQLSV